MDLHTDMCQQVINKLVSLYPNIQVLRDGEERGANVPCFLVKQINAIQHKELNNRYKRLYSFDILYYSVNKDINVDCLRTADELAEGMEYLLDYMARGTNIHYQIIDDVLHFYVDYGIRLIKQEQESPIMMDISTKGDLKH